MMSSSSIDILVVGSVAFDSVETPFGKAEEVLGGSAIYFSISASFFARVGIVAVVGDDFPSLYIEFLKERNIDVRGLKKVKGETFRWKGRYGFDLNDAFTLETRLNVFKDFSPEIPEDYREAEYVFLANIDPELQMRVLEQVKSPKLVALDTMNFWIEGKPERLKEVVSRVDIFIINEAEVREFAQEPNLVKAAKKIISMGPKALIVKRGSYGALLFHEDSIFAAPAYPLEDVYDPTGAGDSFAGGFMGYLANTRNSDNGVIRQAIIFGSVMASFNVEDFSFNRLKYLTYTEIEGRFREFKKLCTFEDINR